MCNNDGTKIASYKRLGWYSLLFHGIMLLMEGVINSPVYLYRCIPFSTFIRGAVVAVKKYRESGDQLYMVTGVSDFNVLFPLAYECGINFFLLTSQKLIPPGIFPNPAVQKNRPCGDGMMVFRDTLFPYKNVTSPVIP
jgi:hypothetical protein